jgi:hypothetical protein
MPGIARRRKSGLLCSSQPPLPAYRVVRLTRGRLSSSLDHSCGVSSMDFGAALRPDKPRSWPIRARTQSLIEGAAKARPKKSETKPGRINKSDPTPSSVASSTTSRDNPPCACDRAANARRRRKTAESPSRRSIATPARLVKRQRKMAPLKPMTCVMKAKAATSEMSQSAVKSSSRAGRDMSARHSIEVGHNSRRETGLRPFLFPD